MIMTKGQQAEKWPVEQHLPGENVNAHITHRANASLDRLTWASVASATAGLVSIAGGFLDSIRMHVDALAANYTPGEQVSIWAGLGAVALAFVINLYNTAFRRH